MRFIVYGVGAIGGTFAASLALSGQEVVGIARGRQLEAIRSGGLTMRTPTGDLRAAFECVGDPSEIVWRDDDVVILTMKAQDTYEALLRLSAAGVSDQAIVCGQNGVENERMALRLFPNVYGMTVVLPATYEVAGVVNAFGVPKRGLLYIGRYPKGLDSVAAAISDGFEQAEIACWQVEETMVLKYGKLVSNVVNIVMAAFSPGETRDAWRQKVRDEAAEVYAKAGVAWKFVDVTEARERGIMVDTPIPGVDRIGSSTMQSLKRDAGSIETDYLNGEIVLMARSLGIDAPLNRALCRIARDLVAGRIAPGEVTADMADAYVSQPAAPVS